MQPESMCWPSAAEFPHDNPRFDEGALWNESALRFSEAILETEPEAQAATALESITEPETALASSEAEEATEAVSEASSAPEVAPEMAPELVLEVALEAAKASVDEAPVATETITEPVLAEAPSEPVLAEAPSEPVLAEAQSEPIADEVATGDPATSDPATDDPIATFVRAVTAVALAHGPADAAAQIESLFHFGTIAEGLSASAQAALCEGKILEATDDGIRTTDAFASTRTAWESILRGGSGDLSACGETTLDTWTADVVARLIASPDKAATIRRDLRRRGIAAFGMLS